MAYSRPRIREHMHVSLITVERALNACQVIETIAPQLTEPLRSNISRHGLAAQPALTAD